MKRVTGIGGIPTTSKIVTKEVEPDAGLGNARRVALLVPPRSTANLSSLGQSQLGRCQPSIAVTVRGMTSAPATPFA